MKTLPRFFSMLIVILVGATPLSIKPRSMDRASGRDINSGPIIQYIKQAQRIAVTEAGWDDIGAILDSLGLEYTEIRVEDLPSYDSIKQFDVIFINCPGFLPGYDAADFNAIVQEYPQGATESLERFVREGGQLYASDWAIYYVEQAFPGYLAQDLGPFESVGGYGGIGIKQAVTADILDPGLQQKLKSQTVNIDFDADYWIVLKSVPDSVHVYLSGDVDVNDRDRPRLTDLPLAVSFPYEKGHVFYTSYHNESGSAEGVTKEQKALLQYLVLAAAAPDGILTEGEPGAPQSNLPTVKIIGGILGVAVLFVIVMFARNTIIRKRSM